MPKIFEESTMRMIYDMVHEEFYKRREISVMFNIPPERIDAIYAAAVRKFGPYRSEKKKVVPDKAKQPLIRPKAEYSNKSYSNYI